MTVEQKRITNKEWNRNNPKCIIKSKWRFRGVIDTDYDLLYDYFIKETNCMICDKVYNKDEAVEIRDCLCIRHNVPYGEWKD